MKAVWKFPLPYNSGVTQDLAMPEGAQVLSVQMQGGDPTMWALVEPDAPTEYRRFRIVGTGHEEVGIDAKHIGTLQDGGYVWHFFDEGLA